MNGAEDGTSSRDYLLDQIDDGLGLHLFIEVDLVDVGAGVLVTHRHRVAELHGFTRQLKLTTFNSPREYPGNSYFFMLYYLVRYFY